MSLSCRIGHRHTSILQGLYIAVSSHKCGISSRPSVHCQTTPHAFLSQTPAFAPIIHHFPCLHYIQTAFFLKQSFTVSVHLFHGLHTERLPAQSPCIDSLSDPIIFHSLQITKPQENTVINHFLYPLRHSIQFPYPCFYDFIHPPNT